jgi:hypothetical protein
LDTLRSSCFYTRRCRADDGNNGEGFFSRMQLRVLGGVRFVLSCRLTLVDPLP